jgi:hypothetical protein
MAKRKSFLLRMNPQLWEDLEAWAQDEMRSVNGQIEFLLKQATAKRKRLNDSKADSESVDNPGTI